MSGMKDRLLLAEDEKWRASRHKFSGERHDRLVGIVVRKIMKYVKSGVEGTLIVGSYPWAGGDDPDEKLIVKLTTTSSDRPGPHNVDAASGDMSDMGDPILEIEVDSTSIGKEGYSALVAELRDAVRHEIEHISQADTDLASNEDYNGDWVGYFTREDEIPAFVQGFHAQAKNLKKTIGSVMRDYLASQVQHGRLDKEEVVKIHNAWWNWLLKNKREFPGINLSV